MSKIKTQQPGQKTSFQEPAAKRPSPSIAGNKEAFRVPYPFLWLALTVLVVYFPSLSNGLTELDDTIFIRDFHDYNEHLGNLFTSFHRGLFDATKDPYYRPLFMDSMILNNLIGEYGNNIGSYHAVNILLHMGSVLILFKLFLKLDIKELHAFILCLLFAVHPVLSQAVSWIPGRNDTMLAIFTFSFLSFSVDYAKSEHKASLLFSALFLLLAFFTKETAVFAAPVAFVLLVFFIDKKWNNKSSLIQYGVWTACFATWFLVRASATPQTNISFTQVIHDFIPRVPLIAQYIGKVFFPFNLSVFPIQQDTVYYYGFAAIILLVVIIILSKKASIKKILGGFAVFLLFLLPALFVPGKLNEQSFEHRLYLPVIGILLVLSQTSVFNNKLKEVQLFFCAIAVCLLFAAINYQHQKSFEDPLTFWTKAAESSPHSAFANMMLAARLDKDDFGKSCSLFQKAYQLNPDEKYLNFYYGLMLQKKDSVLASEKYLLKEKNTSGYYECDFYLARVAMEKKDLNGAIACLEAYVKKDTKNGPANNNLLLLYHDTQQTDKARNHIKEMQKNGLLVPKEMLQLFGM